MENIAQMNPDYKTDGTGNFRHPRSCYIALQDNGLERIILRDTWFSPALSAVHHKLADFGVPQRVGYCDDSQARIMFDSFEYAEARPNSLWRAFRTEL